MSSAFRPGLQTAYMTVEFDLRALGGITQPTRTLIRHLANTPNLLPGLVALTADLTLEGAADTARAVTEVRVQQEMSGGLHADTLPAALLRQWLEDVDWHSVGGYLIWARPSH